MVSRSRRAKTEDYRYFRWGWIALALLLVIVAGACFLWYLAPKPLNVATLCPADGPRGHIVLLIDKTDVPHPVQKAAIDQAISNLAEGDVPEGYLLSVFALDEDFRKTATPLVEVCNPGDGRNKNEFTTTTSRLKKKYTERFLNPVLAVSEEMVARQPAKWSPVFEMLQLVGINAFKHQNVDGERRLVILSDMLHNTSEFSMYQNQPDFDTFAATDYGQRTGADLRGVNVEIDYIITAPKLQTRSNLLFWEKYFSKAGATIRKVTPLEG